MRFTAFALVVALAGPTSLGCKGDLSLQSDGTPGSGTPTKNNSTGGPVIDPFPDTPCEGAACETPVVSPTPGAVRLTHVQWENATRDLLKLDARSGLSRNFIKDTRGLSIFDRLTDKLEVNPDLWDDYREASETLAAQVTQNPDHLARLAPEQADSDARLRAFITSAGLRAFRRPLLDDEIARYQALADEAEAVFGAGNATFEKRVELVLRALLQSPHFLYRVESTAPQTGQVVALSGYERAARLSFALWNSIPDDELLTAAADGRLDDVEGFTTQAKRLMADPRALDVVQDFHWQFFQFDHFDEMTKASELFPEFNENTPEAMREEIEHFVAHVVHETPGTYRDLLTSRVAFVDDELAALYGVSAPAEPFGQVELPGTQRAGLLTRVAFLAANATAYDPNPIHRGKFVNRNILCNVVPPPPDMFTIPDGVPGNTNRERIENATGECGGACHTPLLNPAGYAFEGYDAVGRWRTMDGNFPVDTAGAFPFGSQLVAFEGPLDLSEKIAESERAHECYVKHWFEYLHQRTPLAGDAPLIARVAQVSHKNNVPIEDLVVGLLVNDLFLKRAGEAP